MTGEVVLLEIKDSTAYVTLNRPDVHNAFDEDVIARLSEALDRVAAHDDVTAVVLTGKGKSFSAGADLNWMKKAAGYTEAQNKADALKLAQMLYKLYTLPKITIACVQGAAMGGGMGLVSCCDIVIAESDAVFALSEVKLGLIPATIAPYVLRAIGERHFRRYAQTGERFDGKKAHETGLVHRLAERPEDTEYLLHATLKDIAANGPQAMTAVKKLALDYAGREITPALTEDSAARIATIRAGGEAKEGLSAFLEKRKPRWCKA